MDICLKESQCDIRLPIFSPIYFNCVDTHSAVCIVFSVMMKISVVFTATKNAAQPRGRDHVRVLLCLLLKIRTSRFILIQQRKRPTINLFSSFSIWLCDCLFPAKPFSQFQSTVLFYIHDSASVFCAAYFFSAAPTPFFLTWITFHTKCSPPVRLRLCSCTISKALDDTFVSGSSSGLWGLFRNTKATQKAIFHINSNIKGCNNAAPRCSVCQQSDATTSLNPKLICLHRIWSGPVGWEERTGDCVLFLPPASQTVALTKYPFCAVSFHSDWTNWDLLTANPIRAGTGQSCLGICHPWHTGLPLPS